MFSIQSPTPMERSASSPFAWKLIQEPRWSASAGSCSKTSTSKPILRRATASVGPATPPPTMSALVMKSASFRVILFDPQTTLGLDGLNVKRLRDSDSYPRARDAAVPGGGRRLRPRDGQSASRQPDGL